MDIDQKKEQLYDLLKIKEKKERVEEIEEEMSLPDFWRNPQQARQTMQELSHLKEIIDQYEKASKEEEIEKLEFQTLFYGPYDQNNALVSIHAGAGGTEAQDWAGMLLRMYQKWAEKKGFRYQILDVSQGEEAGIKSATVSIEGAEAFGWLKSESGVHRLVRLSPFDADKARHTSFALVEVIPETKEAESIKLEDKDLKIDTYRAGGHGGQNVNKLETAVRVTHLPTNISVACQNERSQSQNKAQALKILQAKLYKLKMQEEAKKREELRGEFQSPEWGSQIRSYVLHPYKMVKDHRTDIETSDAEGVLNGELDGFIIEYLKANKNF